VSVTAKLLGSASLCHNGTWLESPHGKTSALLYYLTYQDTWVSRDHLIYLFWPDTLERNARNNLRRLLSAIRDLDYTEGIEIEATRVRWSIDSDIKTFKQNLAKQKWARAVELYQDELLQGFKPSAPEFENWLELERQELRTLWRNAVLTLANDFETKEQYGQAAEVLKYLQETEPFGEIVFRRYLTNLQQSGQQQKALEVFESFKNSLERDYDNMPEWETLELIGAIRQGKVLVKTATATKRETSVTNTETKPSHNLPVQATRFVGRETEQKKLTELLTDPNCRLVTIIALGGMGKTRLALEVAKSHLEHFGQVCFVSFAAVASPDLMVYTLADELELSLFGSQSPKEQVLDYLKNKKLLLVLDNLEHLLSGVDLISDILATASEIKILATSRESLDLQSENLFDLYGLMVPDPNSSGADSFDSLQLFAERAKHNRLDFVLEHNLQAVTRICQLVGGMPLAIELAASWSRLLSPEEIAKELEQSLEILSTSTLDLAERHHRMQSVFEASWHRLSEDEQRALRKLSVFQDGFDREAAQAVTELNMPILLSLVNKSFLWRDTSGRFSQHPLVLHYVGQKAKDYPNEVRQIGEKHGLYYLHMVEGRAFDLGTQKGQEAREVLDNELPNIRAAWDWALRETRVGEIKHYTKVLGEFFAFEHNHEGVAIFKRAVAALDETNPEHHAALGYVLSQQAWHELIMDGNPKSIIENTQRGLALLAPLEEFPGMLLGQVTLGTVLGEQGEFGKAKDILTEALSLARTYGSPSDIGWVLNRLSIPEGELGDFSEMSTLMGSNLKELRGLGDLPNLCLGLSIVGSYLVANNRLDEGEKLLLESLELGQKTAVVPVPALTELARLAYKRSDFQKAERFALAAYEAALKHHDEASKAINLAIQGKVKLAQGSLGEAEYLLVKSLSLSWAVNMPLPVAHSLVYLAELSIAKGQVKQAATLLSFLSHYRIIEKRDRDEAIKFLEQARQHSSPRAFSQAQEESKTLTLEAIVTEILARRIG
jgi:DNA-binding SARP family transcriptional activator